MSSVSSFTIKESLCSLCRSPRDLWILYILESLFIIPFTMSVIGGIIYNIRILNFTDQQSGYIIASMGISIAISSLALSAFPARYGPKLAIMISSFVFLAFNLSLLLNLNRYLQVLLSFFLFIPSSGLAFISFKLAVKFYTISLNRSIGFSIYFMIYFVAGGIAAAILDEILFVHGKTLAGFTIGFYVNIAFSGLWCIGCFFIRDINLEQLEEGTIIHSDEQSGWKFTMEVVKNKKFWRFFALIMMLTIIKSMYMHLVATLPIYMLRSLGEDSRFSILMGIHQVILPFFIPLFTGLVNYFDFYRLLEIGSFVTSISPLILIFGDNLFLLAVFVVVLSIGESIYAPRLLDYTVKVAPKGKEAAYLGLAHMPNTLSLFITGITSGIFLANFCPQEGEKNCKIVWLLIGVYCLIACVIVTFFRNFFEGGDQVMNEEIKVEMI